LHPREVVTSLTDERDESYLSALAGHPSCLPPSGERGRDGGAASPGGRARASPCAPRLVRPWLDDLPGSTG
jgi:hypothetical protein